MRKKIVIYIILFAIFLFISLIIYSLFTKSKGNSIYNNDNFVLLIKRESLSNQEIIDNLGKQSILRSFDNYYVLSSDSTKYLDSKGIQYQKLDNVSLNASGGYKIYKVGITQPMNNSKIQDIGVNSIVIKKYPYSNNELLVWAISDKELSSNVNVDYLDIYRIYEKVNPDVFSDSNDKDVVLTFIVNNNNHLSEIISHISKYDENVSIINEKEYIREDIFVQDIKANLNAEEIKNILYKFPELVLTDLR